MVIRTRLRTLLATLGLYVMAGVLIAYFGVHAHSGDRGLAAKEQILRERAALAAELAQLRAERARWSRRLALLRSDSLDPDMLEERARAMLYYVHERDLVLAPLPAAASPAALAAAR